MRDPQTLLSELAPGWEFRPGQRKALQALLDGRDVVAVLPPGGGRSLVAELASAALVGPSLSVDGSPARLVGARLASLPAAQLAERSGPLGLLAVDGAARLADAGPGFRPELRALRADRERLAPAVTLALPPLATPPLVDEIAERLALAEPARVVAGIDVPAVSLDVARLPHERARRALLVRCLREPAARPALVLAEDAVAVRAVAETLASARLRVAEWHAGLPADAQVRAKDALRDGRAEVLVAAGDPGTGAASAWVLGLPGSPEALRALAGRLSARLVLVVTPRDRARSAGRIAALGGSLGDLNALLARLGAHAADDGSVTAAAADERERHLLGLAGDLDALTLRPTATGAVAQLRLRALGARREAEVEAAARRALRLRWEGLAAITALAGARGCRRRFLLGLFDDPAAPAPTGRCCDRCDAPPDLLLAPGEAAPGPARQPRREARQQALHASGPLADALAAWRLERARTERRSPQAVLPDSALDAICERRPGTRVALLELSGMGPRRVARYGDELLALVARAPAGGAATA